MADVGVLNLQIHDNSEQAAGGLNKLADALFRVKRAVSGGLKLTGISTQIDKIAKVVNDSISGSTIEKLAQFGDSLARLKGLGDIKINIKNSDGIAGAVESIQAGAKGIQDLQEEFENVKGQIDTASKAYEEFGERMRRTNDLIQSMNLVGGYDQFREMLEGFMQMRSSMALGPGSPMTSEIENGLTVWKDGAIEVEGTVSDATNSINGYLEGTQLLLTGVVDETNEALVVVENFVDATKRMRSEPMVFDPATGDFTKPLSQSLEELKQKQEETRRSHQGMMKAFDAAKSGAMGEVEQKWAKSLEKVTAEAKAATMQVQELVDWLNRSRDANWSQGIDRMMNIDGPVKSAKESMDVFVNSMHDMTEAAGDVQKLNPELKEYALGAEEAAKESLSFRDRLKELKKEAGSLSFGKLINQFGRIMKYRILRSILKHITEGFSEGVQNVYEYSKAMGTDLAPAMDSAASALLQMKNSIGAAVAPVIQALIPLLQTVVNWFINLVNSANQFFALIRGQQTWTRALPATANAFGKQEKAAKGAGAAIKDLLADWDELNLIQSESGGSGSGSSLAPEDYLSMFEEVEEFNDKIKKVTDFIKNNMDDILDVVKDIGIALLAWKFSNVFTGPLGTLAGLVAAGKIIEVTWELTEMFDNQYMETGDNGWLVKDALTNLVGDFFAGSIIETVLGGGTGLITAGIGMTVSAGISYGIAMSDPEGDYAKALKDFALVKFAVGAAAMAAGFGIASGSAVLGILSAATIAAPLFVLSAGVAIAVKQYETAAEIAKEAFSATGEGGIKVDEIYKALQDELTKAASGYSLLISGFEGAAELKTNLSDAFSTIVNLTATIRGDGKLTQSEAEAFKKAWSTVFESFEGLTKQSFDEIFTGLNISLQSENDELRKQAQELRTTMLSISENLTQAEAEFRIRQEELTDKVIHGTATEDELNEYFDNLELMAQMTKTSMVDFENAIKNKDNIDFGDPDNAVANAVNFVQSASEAAQTATEEVQKGYQSAIEAVDNIWREIEAYHDYGKIDDKTYKAYQEVFDTMRENFKEAKDDNLKKIEKEATDAYETVVRQVLEGFTNIDQFVDEAGNINTTDLIAYFGEIVAPIFGALKDSGLDFEKKFGEEFAKMFMIGINIKNWAGEGWGKKLEDYLRTEILKMEPSNGVDVEVPMDVEPAVDTKHIMKEIQHDLENGVDVRDAISDAIRFHREDAVKEALPHLGIEVDLSGEDGIPMEISSVDVDEAEGLNDIRGTIRDTLNNALQEGMSDTDFEELVRDLSAEYGEDIVREIQKEIDTPIEPPTPDLTAFNKSLADSAQFLREWLWLRDMMNKGDQGASYSGTYAMPHVKIPGFATGGFPDSGNLFMADENGNIEMKGKMGNQAVVANNQQIVSGISQGVSTANESVVSELRTVVTMLQRMLDKEFVAKATPGSDWGRHNARSEAAYDRVTGM